MDKSSPQKSSGTSSVGNNIQEDIKGKNNDRTGTLLNGKNHSGSTEFTTNKNFEVTERQNQNFINRIEQFPKKKTGIDSELSWERQFLKGVSSEMSINEEDIDKSKHSGQEGSKTEKGNSALKYMKQKGVSFEDVHLNKMQQYQNNPNPFKLKAQELLPPLQSKVLVVPPSQSSKIFSSNQQSIQPSGILLQRQRQMPRHEQSLDREALNKSEESKDSNENIFRIPPRDEARSSSNSIFKLPGRNTFLGTKHNGVEDDSEQLSNIYDKLSKRKNKESKFSEMQGYNIGALEKILKASGIYKDYLLNLNRNNQSICIAEIGLAEKTKLPQEFFFKPERVIFNRIKEDLPREYNYNGFHLIGKANKKRTKFFFQDLKQDRLKNMRGLKCREISFAQELQISPNVEYDYENKRFFIYSNSEQKVYVYSEGSLELICSFKTKKKVFDPHLYLHQINNRMFLLIIGGYNKIEKKIAQGNKFIEIFELKRWEIELKSETIKLVIGRISPIVTTVFEKNETKLLIMGGNSIARINDNNSLNYEYQREINESTNLTGFSLPSQQIIELFDYSQQAVLTNYSVKTLNPFSLHDGCVIPVNNISYLLLPECKHLIQMKILNKEINLIEGKKYEYIPEMKQIQRRQLCLNYKKGGIEIYRITEEGCFSIIDSEVPKQGKFCLIY